MGEAFVDGVYEASFIPEKWPVVLQGLAASAEALAAYLFTVNGGVSAWISSPGASDLMAAFMASGFAADNVRARRAEALRHPGFITDLDILTADQIDAEPMYRDFLRPHGIGWAVGTHIWLPTGDILSFNIERRLERGPVERHFVDALDAVRPHLARSAMVGARLQLTRAQAAAATLEMLGMPAAVLGSRGQMLAANALLDPLLPAMLQDRRDRIRLTDGKADMLLANALSALKAAGPSKAVQSFPLADSAGAPVAVAHVLPVKGEAHDLFASSSAILVIMPLAAAANPSTGLLQALFDLTVGEARIALALAEGHATEEIAQKFAISRETVRTHLRSIFAKTGVSKQSALLRILNRVALPGMPAGEGETNQRAEGRDVSHERS